MTSSSIITGYCIVSFFNNNFLALVDSGAGATCISVSILNKLGLTYNKTSNTLLRTISNAQIKPLGSIDANIVFADAVFSYTFQVLDLPYDQFILGNDFANKYKTNIDYETGSATLMRRFSSRLLQQHEVDNFKSLLSLNKETSTLAQRKQDNNSVKTGDSNDFATTKKKETVKNENTADVKTDNQDLQDLPPQEICALTEDINCITINEDLDQTQVQQIRRLLNFYEDRFAYNTSNLGAYNGYQIDIETTDEIPVHKPPYRTSQKQKELIEEQVQEMLRNNIIERSQSPYASPVVIVEKADGKPRFCIDFRALNKKIKADAYPIPKIEDLLSCLEGARYFAELDLNSGYWQLRLGKGKEKTSFITQSGLYSFKTLPFGLKTSQAVFQRAMDTVLAELKYKTVLVYVDNIIVYAKTFKEFILALEQVLRKFQKANLTLKPTKCKIGFTKLTVLGHTVSAQGIEPVQERVKAMQDAKAPTNIKELRSTLGLFSYYRKFINDFAQLTLPLTNLTKKGQTFKWNIQAQEAFEEMKRRICEAPILQYFSTDENVITRLFVDASDQALGACLMQGKSEMKPVAFASRKLTDAEKRYAITEKECLGLIWALSYFKQYLWGLEFEVVTDHRALVWLRTKRDMNGRLARWALAIQPWNFKIIYCKGKDNIQADFLSRNPLYEEDNDIQNTQQPDGLCLYSFETQDLVRLQQEDNYCKEMMDKLENKTQHKAFHIKNKILCKKVWTDNMLRNVIVLPEKLFIDCIHELHDNSWGGAHFGLYKTLKKFKNRYYMENAEKKIEDYIKSCTKCQEKNIKTVRAPLINIKVEQFGQRIALDVLGPFCKSKDGHRYVIGAIEYLSKYAICKAVPRVTSEVISQFLIENIFCNLGGIKCILTDRGSVFTSKQVHKTVEEYGAKIQHSTAFNPRTQGLIERLFKTLSTSLSKYVQENQKDWSNYLPKVIFSYNASAQASTGLSPYNIVYGREPCLSMDIELKMDEEPTNLQEKVNHIKNLENLAKKRISKAQSIQKTYYDKKSKDISFAPNDLVMVLKPRRLTGRSLKLCRLYKGPYKILNSISKVNYLVQRLSASGRAKNEIVHVNKLKKYHTRIIS